MGRLRSRRITGVSGRPKTAKVNPGPAQNHFAKAREFRESMNEALSAGRGNPAALNAVHCAISAADSACVRFTGKRSASRGHGDAVLLLAECFPGVEGRRQADRLGAILAKKNQVEYEERLFTKEEAANVVKQAQPLFDIDSQFFNRRDPPSAKNLAEVRRAVSSRMATGARCPSGRQSCSLAFQVGLGNKRHGTRRNLALFPDELQPPVLSAPVRRVVGADRLGRAEPIRGQAVGVNAKLRHKHRPHGLGAPLGKTQVVVGVAN